MFKLLLGDLLTDGMNQILFERLESFKGFGDQKLQPD